MIQKGKIEDSQVRGCGRRRPNVFSRNDFYFNFHPLFFGSIACVCVCNGCTCSCNLIDICIGGLKVFPIFIVKVDFPSTRRIFSMKDATDT